MTRSTSHPGIAIVALMISASLAIESSARQVQQLGNAFAASPPGAKRKVGHLTIAPEDRAILLKSLSDAARDAESLPDPQQRVNNLMFVACGLTLAGEAGKAHAIMDKVIATVPELPGELTAALSLLWIAARLAECGDMADARAAVAAATGPMKNLETVNRINAARGIAKAQAMIGGEVGAKEALEWSVDALTRMTSEVEWQRSLPMTVEGFIEIGDFGRALDIAGAIPEKRDDLKQRQIEAIAKKVSRATPEIAKATLARALEIAKVMGPNPYKAESLASIAVAQAETGDIAGAIATSGAIGEGIGDRDVDGFKPVTLIAIASAQAASGDREKSRASFTEALQLARAIGPWARDRHAVDHQNTDLRARRLHEIAAGQARSGMVPDALATADLIKENDFRKSRALSAIGDAQVGLKDLPGAVASFRRAFELADGIETRPNDPGDLPYNRRQWALYESARGMARARDFDQATKIADRLLTLDPKRKMFHTQDVLPQIARERAWTGDIHGALKAGGEIADPWSRRIAHERIAELEGEAGGEAHACGWIAEFNDPDSRLRLIWSLVTGLAKRSNEPAADLPDLSTLKSRNPAAAK